MRLSTGDYLYGGVVCVVALWITHRIYLALAAYPQYRPKWKRMLLVSPIVAIVAWLAGTAIWAYFYAT